MSWLKGEILVYSLKSKCGRSILKNVHIDKKLLGEIGLRKKFLVCLHGEYNILVKLSGNTT